jgi:hypothetical protein
MTQCVEIREQKGAAGVRGWSIKQRQGWQRAQDKKEQNIE